MASEWYYAKGDQQYGPCDGTQLKQLAAAGEFGPDDLVWREGMSEWIAAAQVKGLFDAAAVEQHVVAQAAAAPVQEQTQQIAYYNPMGGLEGKIALALKGFPAPMGTRDHFPLSEDHQRQFRNTEAHRKHIRRAGMLYRVLGIILIVFAAFHVITFMSLSLNVSGMPSGVVLSILATVAFEAVIAVLCFIASRATYLCRTWAPIVMLVLFALGIAVVIGYAVMLFFMIGRFGGPGEAMFVIMFMLISCIFQGVFIWMSIAAMRSIPRFLACPLWCVYSLVDAKL